MREVKRTGLNVSRVYVEHKSSGWLFQFHRKQHIMKKAIFIFVWFRRRINVYKYLFKLINAWKNPFNLYFLVGVLSRNYSDQSYSIKQSQFHIYFLCVFRRNKLQKEIILHKNFIINIGIKFLNVCDIQQNTTENRQITWRK